MINKTMSQVKKCVIDIYKWKNDNTSPVGCILKPNEHGSGSVDLTTDKCGITPLFKQFINNDTKHKTRYSGVCPDTKGWNPYCIVKNVLEKTLTSRCYQVLWKKLYKI